MIGDLTPGTPVAWADEENGDPVEFVGTIVEPTEAERAFMATWTGSLRSWLTQAVLVQHPKGWRRWVHGDDLRP